MTLQYIQQPVKLYSNRKGAIVQVMSLRNIFICYIFIPFPPKRLGWLPWSYFMLITTFY